LDFNVDISIDDIVALYDKKLDSLPEEKSYAMPIDVNKEILKILSNLNNKELKLLVYINQAILNFLMSNDQILESMTNSYANEELFEVIL
jgi:hypothetical protein